MPVVKPLATQKASVASGTFVAVRRSRRSERPCCDSTVLARGLAVSRSLVTMAPLLGGPAGYEDDGQSVGGAGSTDGKSNAIPGRNATTRCRERGRRG